MPHVIVKLYPGRTEEQKRQLTDEIVRSVVSIAGCTEDAVSVGFEEVPPDQWVDAVYKPNIASKQSTLYKKPGYTPET